jgi:hypothetical protein
MLIEANCILYETQAYLLLTDNQMPKIIPTDIPNAVPVGDDVGIFVDVSDLNKLKKNTLTENVRAGLSNLDTDDLSE